MMHAEGLARRIIGEVPIISDLGAVFVIKELSDTLSVVKLFNQYDHPNTACPSITDSSFKQRDLYRRVLYKCNNRDVVYQEKCTRGDDVCTRGHSFL